MISKKFRMLVIFSAFAISKSLFCANQTDTVTSVQSQDSIPFTIMINQADFSLPNGLHSFVSGHHKGKWLLLAGRTNGLHGFDSSTDNFPPQEQNTIVYVVDPAKKTIWSKSLSDPTSGLTQNQIDLLSVTNAQFYQDHETLYMIGGYGVDSATGEFSTKDSLFAIDIPGLMHWVKNPSSGEKASQHIRYTSHPLLQVTGGYLYRAQKHLPYLLIFGQNFTGYYSPGSNGEYTQQIRTFQIIDSGKKLYVLPEKSYHQNPNYRRRDLNIVPIIQKTMRTYIPAYIALSGVFTLTDGAWTVPVMINQDGSSFMPNPSKASTFKQAMNNYTCATFGLFSQKTNDMYVVLLGGITYGYFENGSFETDSEMPFTNQVTTIRINRHGSFSQHLMNNEYPEILSTSSNPGNPLLFGAEAKFFPLENLPMYENEVIRLEKLGKGSILLGYVVGGIQSTLPNTNVNSDSAASPYIFEVRLQKQ